MIITLAKYAVPDLHLECPVIPLAATSGLWKMLALAEAEFRPQGSSQKLASAAGHYQGPAGRIKFQQEATGTPFNLKDFLSVSCQWQHYTGAHHRQWNQSLPGLPSPWKHTVDNEVAGKAFVQNWEADLRAKLLASFWSESPQPATTIPKSGCTKRTTQLLLSLTKKHKVMLAGIELLAHFSALLLNIEVASFFFLLK